MVTLEELENLLEEFSDKLTIFYADSLPKNSFAPHAERDYDNCTIDELKAKIIVGQIPAIAADPASSLSEYKLRARIRIAILSEIENFKKTMGGKSGRI